MINRRTFLKFMFSASTALMLKDFKPLLASGQEILSLFDIYVGFARRMGGKTTKVLCASEEGQRIIIELNSRLASAGYRMSPTNEPLADFADLLDVHRRFKYRYRYAEQEIISYPLGIDTSFYPEMNTLPMPDIMVIWMKNCSLENMVSFGGPTVLATSTAAAMYAYENFGAETSNDLTVEQKAALAEIFFPDSPLIGWSPGIGGTFASPEEVRTSYQSLSGNIVSTHYVPPPNTDGLNASVNITVTGIDNLVIMDETFNFDIVA